jgi:hypothetical protein
LKRYPDFPGGGNSNDDDNALFSPPSLSSSDVGLDVTLLSNSFTSFSSFCNVSARRRKSDASCDAGLGKVVVMSLSLLVALLLLLMLLLLLLRYRILTSLPPVSTEYEYFIVVAKKIRWRS